MIESIIKALSQWRLVTPQERTFEVKIEFKSSDRTHQKANPVIRISERRYLPTEIIIEVARWPIQYSF